MVVGESFDANDGFGGVVGGRSVGSASKEESGRVGGGAEESEGSTGPVGDCLDEGGALNFASEGAGADGGEEFGGDEQAGDAVG